MSKIYVICNRHDENLLSLYQEALYLGYEVIPFYHKKYDESLEEFYSKVTKEDYVIVLHTSFGSELLHHLVSRTQCKKFLNGNAFRNSLIGSKLFQQNKVKEHDSSIIIPTYTKDDVSNLPIPFIAKPSDATSGAGVVLLNNKSLIENAPDNYIFQQYIPNDGDWRVVVIGGKGISAIKRLGKVGQPTNNIATGSFAIKEINTDILDKIYQIAELAAKILKFDYVGIDIIKDLTSGKYYFLESNERPTFETSQILTGKNIAQEIIKELVK